MEGAQRSHREPDPVAGSVVLAPEEQASQRRVRLLDGSLVLVVQGDRGAGEIAARQHGCVSTAQLNAVGVHRNGIAHRVAAGRIHLLHRGVYLLGRTLPTPLGAVAAALLATAPAVASHRSAAALWDLLPTQPPFPEVTIARDRRVRRPGITVHRAETADRRLRQGVPVTSPARTLLDLAATLPTAELARAVAEAHVKGLARGPELEAILHTGRPGTSTLRAILAAGAHRSRSRPERDLLALCREARLPPPEVNSLAEGFEVDAAWPDQRLIVEVDTFGTHGHAQAFASDRRRDLALHAAGYSVIRVTDAQLAHDRLAVAAILAARLA